MSQYAKEIKHILATLNEQGDEDDASLPDEEELDTIHVYPLEGGGILFTRTPIEPEEAAPPVIDSQDDHTIPTPAELPAAAIHASSFAPLTLSLSQTIPAAGSGHQDARQATGTLTFHNGLITPQFAVQGTVFTGSDGVRVVTDQSVSIPANTPPVDGQATIAAHALHAGRSGNIAAGDITIALNTGLLVKNSQFTNGQDARIAGIQHATIAGITDDNPVPLDITHIRIILLYGVA